MNLQDEGTEEPPRATSLFCCSSVESDSSGTTDDLSSFLTTEDDRANRGQSDVTETYGNAEDSGAAVLLDLNNQMHVDTTTDKAYTANAAQDTGHYQHFNGSQQAIKAMRETLDLLPPLELVENEFGDAVSIEAVSSQYLPRLQAKIWRDIPKIRAADNNESSREFTKESVMVAHSVRYIAEALSDRNTVFVLRPRTIQPCHSVICEHIHKSLKQVYSEEMVTLEPLVDWITVDLATDLTPLWFNLYRRNKILFEKFSIKTTDFIPRNPLRLCLECLLFMADERMSLGAIIDEDPNMLHPGLDSPWLKPEDDINEDEKNLKELDEVSDVSSSTMIGDSTGETTTAISDNDIPQLEGTYEFERKAGARKLEIWRDPTRDHNCEGSHSAVQTRLHAIEHGLIHTTLERESQLTNWTAINSPVALTAPSLDEGISIAVIGPDTSSKIRYQMDPNDDIHLHGTFAMSEEAKYPTARAGFPIGPGQEYQHKRGIVFPAAPMADYGLIRQAHSITGSDYDSQAEADDDTPEAPFDGTERRFGDELDSNLHIIIIRRGPDALENPPLPDLVIAEPPREAEAPAPRTPNRSISRGGYTWPAPKESTAPVPAQPAAGCKVISKSLYPHASQPICLCKQPARTGSVRIIQCQNPDCSIRWYHYVCLKDAREKGYARYGVLLCEVCKGDGYWAKAQVKTDQSMPLTCHDVLGWFNAPTRAIASGNPYGLGQSEAEANLDKAANPDDNLKHHKGMNAEARDEEEEVDIGDMVK